MGDNECIPQKIINIVKALYDGFDCAVVDEKATSQWFKIMTGVKQGCTMSGFLFLLIIDWIIRHTTNDQKNRVEVEIYIKT